MSAITTNSHALNLNNIREIFGTTDPEKMLNMITTSVVREIKSGEWYELIMPSLAQWHRVEYHCSTGTVEITDGLKTIATLVNGKFFTEVKNHVEKNASIMAWF